MSSVVKTQASFLVSRNQVPSKFFGRTREDTEFLSVLESIGLSLILNPRTVLYFTHLARNRLVSTANSELAILNDLRDSVIDSANRTTPISDHSKLTDARNALLGVTSSGKFSSDSVSIKKFNSSVDKFLSEQLAGNVKKRNSAELKRSGTEASSTIPSLCSQLESKHKELLELLYAIRSCVRNFSSAPLNKLYGSNVSYLAVNSIDSVIKSIEEDNSGSNSSDIARKLLACKGTVNSIIQVPKYTDPVISSTSQLPTGYDLSVESFPSSAIVTSSQGPYALSEIGTNSITVTTAQGSATGFFFKSGVSVGTNPILVGSSVQFPISESGNLFIRIDTSITSGFTQQHSVSPQALVVSNPDPAYYGQYSHTSLGSGWELDSTTNTLYKVVLVPLTSGMTLSSVISAINAAISPFGTCYEFSYASTQPGPARLFINIPSGPYQITSISIAPLLSEVPTVSGIARTILSNSVHSSVGFSIGQSGTVGPKSPNLIAESLNNHLGSLVNVTAVGGSLKLVGVSQMPGAYITLSGTSLSEIGLSPGTVYAYSNMVKLVGKVRGVLTNPFVPQPLVSVGDSVSTQLWSSKVSGFVDNYIVLGTAVRTVSGDVTVTSSLVNSYDVLLNSISTIIKSYVSSSKFNEGTSSITSLANKAANLKTGEARNKCVTELDSLEALLTSIISAATVPNSLVQKDEATTERINANSILNTLRERKLDKASDFLSSGKVINVFEMTVNTASYAGAAMDAMSDMAVNNFVYPNRSLDEGIEASDIVEGG